jgi:hypothetical protein
MFDDEYPTCARTYATLLIYPGDLDPTVVTERLGIEPSSRQRRGEAVRRDDGRPGWVAPLNGWFLTTRGRLDSRDSRRHVGWLLDRVEPKAEAVRSLRQAGCRMTVSCFWLSQGGHGGPTVPVDQMRRLADLGIELWFDFYGPYDDDRRPSRSGFSSPASDFGV